MVQVMTWNLWWRFGEWERRRDAILRVLDGTRPDVCGLQEVWDDGDQNLAGWLAGELGYHWTYAPSPAPQAWQRRIGAWDIGIGNAVLSRWPIVETAVVDLAGEDGRIALFASIDSESGSLPFFTTQLTSTVGASSDRCEQVATVCRFVADRSAGFRYPPVLTGDLNAEPESDEMRLLGGHYTAPVVPGLVLVDAWRYADDGATGVTWQRRNPYVAVTMEPNARIDYVHVGLPLSGGVGCIKSVVVVADGPVDGVWPSDHAAVVAEIGDPSLG
ncbi:endonuclease/exonuclease/phosphatase family protein [Kribbella sp. CA-294648]|uniref:endonuclease/exonuclease/phosphatase family protein n=1 Tax=Kribbella sp. CA-294648 TaxID=3239948 RepID=UPI003D8EDB17